MKKETIDRLLEEGLKNYSRVEPPEDFVWDRLSSLSAVRQARMPILRRWWLWAPAPIAAAALLALLVVIPRRSDVPPPPAVRAVAPPAGFETTPVYVAGTVKKTHKGQARMAVPTLRILSPEELASLRIPAGLFPTQPPPDQVEIKEISIPDLIFPATESNTTERTNPKTEDRR